MSSSKLIMALSGLALGLIVAIAWTRPKPVPDPIQDSPKTSAQITPQLPVPEERVEIAELPPPAPLPFAWDQVESADYREYIAKLRAIECPEATIRDVIMADINKLYASKEEPFKTALAGLKTVKVGTNDAARIQHQRKEYDLRKQLWTVEKEKQTVVLELLGVAIPLEPLRGWYSRSYARYESALNALPAPKREIVRGILENYWEASDQLNDKYNSKRTGEYLEEYKSLNQQRNTQMAQVLAPDELADYEMRTSSTANRLLSQLKGLPFSEEEFRQLYQAKADLETPFGGSVRLEMTENVEPEAVQGRRRELDEKINQVLGPERFAEYQRHQDGDYQRLLDLGLRYQLDQNTLVQALELQKTMKVQRDQILRTEQASPQQRQEQATASVAQYQNQLRGLLGDRAFKAYNRRQRYDLFE